MLSASVMFSNAMVVWRLTYSALRPVSGCVRTTGWWFAVSRHSSSLFFLARSTPEIARGPGHAPVGVQRAHAVEHGLEARRTTRRRRGTGSRTACRRRTAGTSTAYSTEPIGGRGTCGVSECQSSPMIFVSPGLRTMSITAGSALEPWMFGCRKSVPKRERERLVLRDVEMLVAEEDHAVTQERLVDGRERGVRQVLREIDAEHLRAQRARDGLDADARTPPPSLRIVGRKRHGAPRHRRWRGGSSTLRARGRAPACPARGAAADRRTPRP